MEHLHRHGILPKRASIAHGVFVSDCGRICGIHKNSGVNILQTAAFLAPEEFL